MIGYRYIRFSYQQTYIMAQKVATLLEQNGVKKGDSVLICAPNSPFWGIVYWGCLLKGAVVVPLNIQSTKEIIEPIIAQTKARIIFDYSGFKPRFEKLVRYQVDFIDELLESITINFKPQAILPSDLFQIMYTSGTTGYPKGVMLTHQNIVSNLFAIDEIIHPNSKKDRVLSILPLSHIYEQTIGLLLPAINQVEVVYAHNHNSIRPLLAEHKITKMLAVPEFLQLFMGKIEAGVESRGRTKSFQRMMHLSHMVNCKWFARLLFRPILNQFGGYLETIASGGAPLTAALETKWKNLGIDILQGYGLTEASPVITTNTYTKYRLGSVGQPLSNVQVKIDETGEIWAKGPNIFSGYYQDPTTTARVLVDGWFNTEDMGQFDQDGYLYIKGRKKYMIISPSGQNVYPEDIEAVLQTFSEVKDACVIGLHDKIHAVLLLNNPNTDVPKLITQANQQLASYQIISGWSIWQEEDFPRTATRKIKKNEVEKIIANNANNQSKSDEAQFSHLTKILAQIGKVDIQKIKPNTKIISELNLDSLSRVELINTIEEVFDATISETELTPDLTVIQLEELIKAKPPVAAEPPLKKWPRSWWAHSLRYVLQTIFLVLLRVFVRLKIEGKENLQDLSLPVIFMPNHLSYLDGSILCMALPFCLRKQLAFAAARDFLYEQLHWLTPLSELLFNTFPIQREGDTNIKLGLEYIGKILDQGYSVAIFPEGKVSPNGEPLPLKPGAGLIATSMFAQIIPVKIEGVQKILPYEKVWPRHRGSVTVKFGKPLQFKRSDNYLEVTKQIQDAMEKL